MARCMVVYNTDTSCLNKRGLLDFLASDSVRWEPRSLIAGWHPQTWSGSKAVIGATAATRALKYGLEHHIWSFLTLSQTTGASSSLSPAPVDKDLSHGGFLQPHLKKTRDWTRASVHKTDGLSSTMASVYPQLWFSPRALDLNCGNRQNSVQNLWVTQKVIFPTS